VHTLPLLSQSYKQSMPTRISPPPPHVNIDSSCTSGNFAPDAETDQ